MTAGETPMSLADACAILAPWAGDMLAWTAVGWALALFVGAFIRRGGGEPRRPPSAARHSPPSGERE
jgi:hypothetical protein